MGALADLYPYIDADESLSRSDFFENILKAYETQDSLYMMPVWYRIRTIAAPTSLVGERVGWNLEEFFDFAQSLPEEKVMFDAGSKSAILRLLKYAYTGQLAYSKNENPDTVSPVSRELLTKILAFANQYEGDENYQYGGAVTARIQEGQVKLLQTRIMEGQDYGALSRIFSEPMTFIGYPTPAGNGNLIQEAVDAIIEEEAVYYFNGVKPLEEVVDVIMNRVQTYVNENR